MAAVSFEVAECRGGLDAKAHYRVVLFSAGDRSGEPKSEYKQGASVVAWDNPFGSASLSVSASQISIALRLKRNFWSRHGRNVYSYVLDLKHDCKSETLELMAINPKNPSPPRLFVTITATGVGIAGIPGAAVPSVIPSTVSPPLQSEPAPDASQPPSASPSTTSTEDVTAMLSTAKVASEDASHEQERIQTRSVPLEQIVENTPGSDLAAVGNAMSSGLSHLDALVKVIDIASDIHPLVKGVWSLFKVAYTLVKQQSDLDEKITTLIQTLEANCSYAEALARNQNTTAANSILKNLLREVLNGASLVKEYCAVRTSKASVFRITLSDIASQVDDCLEVLNTFRRELGDHTTVGIHHNLQALASSLSRDLEHLKLKADRVDKFVEGQDNNALLDQMPYAPEADRALRSDGRGCLPTTRGEIIETLVNWAIGAESDASQLYIRGLRPDSRVLWLCGVAGSGKSSIAISVARTLHSMGRLVALYGFETAFQKSLNPTNLFSTIARQRARVRPAQKHHLLRTLEAIDLQQRGTTSASEQFRMFLASDASTPSASFDDVIIIDALDESGSLSQRAAALLALSPKAQSSTFPSGIRFIVTSRYEHDIAQRLESVVGRDNPSISVLRMQDIQTEHTERDIKTYVFHKLVRVPGLEAEQAAGEITQLAMAAEHSFQWASTACSHITQDDDDALRTPIIRLREILATGVGLDALYLSILNLHFKSSIIRPPPMTRPLRFILGSLVCALEPLSIQTIAALATADMPGSDTGSYRPIARRLSAIVTGTHDEAVPLVPLHTSFTDFLRDPEHSGLYAVVSQDVHAMLGLACLTVMKQSLRFNICRLETSFLRNNDVPDLAERINLYISDELSYACRFWPVHVATALSAACGDTETLRDSLSEFLENKLRVLEWLEVMSVTGTDAWNALSPMSSFQNENSHLRDLIAFTTYFAIPIGTTVPHIYLSALAFMPSSSHIISATTEFPNLVQSSKPLLSWPRIRHKLEHSSSVSCVVFSPDGRWIASGEGFHSTSDSDERSVGLWEAYSGMAPIPRTSTTSECFSVAISPDGTVLASGHKDGTINLWDARTMMARGKPLPGHTDWARSLSFSPDGGLLASGSDDKTIRFWDPLSGSALGEPLTGHAGYVLSVAFSPNGVLLASADSRGHVRFWDVRTSSTVGTPIQAHSEWVGSIAFSPDSTLLATGSGDMTVCFWDVQTRSAVGNPLVGHEEYVRSVSFSPNGHILASCSSDKTVRLWDVGTRSPLGEPLTAHTGEVVSIAFSPDGALLASASADKTVHVWDTRVLVENEESPGAQLKIRFLVAFSRDGMLLASGSVDAIQLWNVATASPAGEPLRGHTNDINCVVFSPDSTLLASGSDDQTVRLWNVPTGSAVGNPLEGHRDWVRAVAFSPDGSLLASGSNDKTVCLWDVQLRSAVGDPLDGHTDSVMCVAFSPNGELLASGSRDRTIRLWDVHTRSMVGQSLTGHNDYINCVTFSPDGTMMASGSDDGTIRIWDVRTHSLVKELLEHDNSTIRCIAFSVDGTLLASGATHGTVQLWDLRTFNEIGEPLRRHTGPMIFLAFSPEGTQLTSTAHDDSICYWDVTSIVRDASLISDSKLQTPRAVLPVLDPLPSLRLDAFMSLEDGWVVGPNKELILWIPPALRHSISNIYEISGPGGPPIVKLDFSKFACGPDWAKCYSPSSNFASPVPT